MGPLETTDRRGDGGGRTFSYMQLTLSLVLTPKKYLVILYGVPEASPKDPINLFTSSLGLVRGVLIRLLSSRAVQCPSILQSSHKYMMLTLWLFPFTIRVCWTVATTGDGFYFFLNTTDGACQQSSPPRISSTPAGPMGLSFISSPSPNTADGVYQ